MWDTSDFFGTLMILIALIAIIAAIAIPNLMQSRLAANETSAAASLRAYLNAQGTYHRQDWDGDGVREYAADLDQLFALVDTDGEIQEPHLIDRAFAEADDDGNVAKGSGLAHNRPRSGYLFHDLTGYIERGKAEKYLLDGKNNNGYVDGFGLTAFPEVHGRTGRHKFVINETGTVYTSDPGDNRPFDLFPDVNVQNWIPIE